MNGKWLLLAWCKYYPAGGLNNIRGVFDTEEEADSVASKLRAQKHGFDYVEVLPIEEILMNASDWKSWLE